ncbi:MAG: oligosaccharide flippase family protein [Clostridia bacterium]|nr:oligosaccharide flippase family protein [Clostridia bacterium]
MINFLKKIGSFSVGPIIGALISFITVPIITHFISPEEYGKASMFILAQSTFSAVMYLGMDQAFVREFNIMKKNITKLLYNAMLIPISLSILTALVSIAFSKNVSQVLFNTPDETLAVYALAFLLPFMVIETFALLKIRMEEKGLLYSFYTILLKTVILIVTILLFVSYEASFRSVVYAASIGEIFTGFLLGIFLIKDNRFSNKLIDKELQKKMLKFGVPLVPAFAVGWILTSMDKVMLRTMCTYEELGVYSAAFKIVSVLSVLQACFTLYWTPVAYRWYQEKKEGKSFENVSKIVTVLMTTICLGILLLKNLVAIILGNDFKKAISIFPFLLLFPVLYTLAETTGIGIGFKRKTWYNILVSFIAGITNIALNWLLIPIFSGTGAAMATGLSYIAFFWGKTLISRKLWYKFDLKIYIIAMLIVLLNCTTHTFLSGWIPYTITGINLIIIFIYILVFVKKNNIVERFKSGELFK